MYQISVVPLCKNLTSHKTFKKSYQKLKNLLYNLLDKNYLHFSDIVEKNTQYDIFIVHISDKSAGSMCIRP